MTKKLTLQGFTCRGKTKFGDRYGYHGSEYLGYHELIRIWCFRHELFFEVTPSNFLAEHSGCPTCGKESFILKKTSTREEFVSSSEILHKLKYTYRDVVYFDRTIHVEITCPKHGNFKQRPYHHLRGIGCKHCAGNARGDDEKFEKDSREVHGDRYDYIDCGYQSRRKLVTVTCRQHGEFTIKAADHLRGIGCKECSKRFSKCSLLWLQCMEKSDGVKIQHALNGGEYRIHPERGYMGDGFAKETNTIYEFQGDFWHGNPQIYWPDDINPMIKKTFGELYQKTLEKKKFILSLGYKFKEIWECDWNVYVAKVIKVQRIYRKYHKK